MLRVHLGQFLVKQSLCQFQKNYVGSVLGKTHNKPISAILFSLEGQREDQKSMCCTELYKEATAQTPTTDTLCVLKSVNAASVWMEIIVEIRYKKEHFISHIHVQEKLMTQCTTLCNTQYATDWPDLSRTVYSTYIILPYLNIVQLACANQTEHNVCKKMLLVQVNIIYTTAMCQQMYANLSDHYGVENYDALVIGHQNSNSHNKKYTV